MLNRQREFTLSRVTAYLLTLQFLWRQAVAPPAAEAAVGFPHFTLAPEMVRDTRRLTWAGLFSEGAVANASSALGGGVIERGPIVLFRDSAASPHTSTSTSTSTSTPDAAAAVPAAALVISPMNHYKKVATNSMPVVSNATVAAATHGWGYGITGFVREYPAGLNLTVVVTVPARQQDSSGAGAGASTGGGLGVHTALAHWGELMRRAHGTPPPDFVPG